jgi:NADH-quinone oxidoreductase subunit A
MSPTSLAAYVVLFGSVGLLFLLVSLLLGRILRPNVPTAVKSDAYECGEPAVGTSYVQFDLRFYVVALVFIVFEVEVALFFPPAVIYGTATRWMNPEAVPASPATFKTDLGVMVAHGKDSPAEEPVKQRDATGKVDDAGDKEKKDEMEKVENAADARMLALAAAADLAAFFAVILLGFAYVWRRGDLNWVRAIDTSGTRPPRQLQVVP